MTENTTRHFALWQKRDRVVLIGYSKKNNDVLVVRLDQLPEDERHDLTQIAMHPNVQNKFELTPVLNIERHSKSGETWLTNIAMRLRRHDGSVMKVYVKDLSDVEDLQMSYYKGYNPPGAPGQLRISEAEKAAVLGDDYRQRQMHSTGITSQSINPPAPQDMMQPGTGTGSIATPAPEQNSNVDIASAINNMAAVMSQVAQRLGNLEEKAKPPRRGRPSTKKAKAAAEPVSAGSTETV